MRDPIYNSTTSINMYFQNSLKPELESIYGDDICIYFQSQQKMSYPNIVVYHPVIGDQTNRIFNYSNDIAFHINVPMAKDMIARKMIDRFYSFTSLDIRNVSKFIVLPVYDYDVTPEEKVGCLRLYMNSGFRRIPSQDTQIIHYMADLSIFYA